MKIQPPVNIPFNVVRVLESLTFSSKDCEKISDDSCQQWMSIDKKIKPREGSGHEIHPPEETLVRRRYPGVCLMWCLHSFPSFCASLLHLVISDARQERIWTSAEARIPQLKMSPVQWPVGVCSFAANTCVNSETTAWNIL